MKLQEELVYVFDFQMVDSILLLDIVPKFTFMTLTRINMSHL